MQKTKDFSLWGLGAVLPLTAQNRAFAEAYNKLNPTQKHDVDETIKQIQLWLPKGLGPVTAREIAAKLGIWLIRNTDG